MITKNIYYIFITYWILFIIGLILSIFSIISSLVYFIIILIGLAFIILYTKWIINNKKINKIKITEIELLEIFKDSIECLADRRHLDYDTYKIIQDLLNKEKIIIKIKSE